MAFSQNLRALMDRNGESGYKLSRSLLCSQTTISYWLCGKTTPTRPMLKALSEHFGCTVEELLRGDNQNVTQEVSDKTDSKEEDKPKCEAEAGVKTP